MDEGRRNWRRLAIEVGDALRAARILIGASQRQVAGSIGVSDSEISRRELGRSARLTGEKLAVHAAAVGLKLWIRLYPLGGGIRDEAQARYIAAFIARAGRNWRVTLEAVVPLPGDLRAVDVLLVSARLRIAVEVVTRLGDLQAQLRAVQAKARDIGADRLIVVVADTRANARALRSIQPSLVSAFDLDTRRVMRELAAGRDPGRDSIVMLRLHR